MRRNALQTAGDRLGLIAYLTAVQGRLPSVEEIFMPLPDEPARPLRVSHHALRNDPRRAATSEQPLPTRE